jgi:hypothetical protein
MEKGLLFCGMCAGRVLGTGEALKSELLRPVKFSELCFWCKLFDAPASAPCGLGANIFPACSAPRPEKHKAARIAPPAGDSCSNVTLGSSALASCATPAAPREQARGGPVRAQNKQRPLISHGALSPSAVYLRSWREQV